MIGFMKHIGGGDELLLVSTWYFIMSPFTWLADIYCPAVVL